jgi:mannose-6-phosphate isomerase-like protein (cupin superfamily)
MQLNIEKQQVIINQVNEKVYRPWGWYETISLGETHQVKLINIDPKAKISLQKHFRRSEHWTVVSGTGIVTCDDDKIFVKHNSYVFIPVESVHTIENTGEEPLQFVEVQCGNYLGEDDIVRLDDIYGRV